MPQMFCLPPGVTLLALLIFILFSTTESLAVNPNKAIDLIPPLPQDNPLGRLLNERLAEQPDGNIPSLPSMEDSEPDPVSVERERYTNCWDQDIVRFIRAERFRILNRENAPSQNPELRTINSYDDALRWLENITPPLRLLDEAAAYGDFDSPEIRSCIEMLHEQQRSNRLNVPEPFSEYSSSNPNGTINYNEELQLLENTRNYIQELQDQIAAYNNTEIALRVVLDIIFQIHRNRISGRTSISELLEELYAVLKDDSANINCNNIRSRIPEHLRRLYNQIQEGSGSATPITSLTHLLEEIYISVQDYTLIRSWNQSEEEMNRSYFFIRDLSFIFVTASPRFLRQEALSLMNTHIYSRYYSSTIDNIPAEHLLRIVQWCFSLNMVFSGELGSFRRLLEGEALDDIYTLVLEEQFKIRPLFTDEHPHYKHWITQTTKRLINPSSVITREGLPHGQVERAERLFSQYFSDVEPYSLQAMSSPSNWLRWFRERYTQTRVRSQRIERLITEDHRLIESFLSCMTSPEGVLEEIIQHLYRQENVRY